MSASRFRSVYFFDGTTGAPLTGLDVATLQDDMSFTDRAGASRTKPTIIEIGGGGYGCTVTEADEEVGVILAFAGPLTSRVRFQLRTVARDRLLAWVYTVGAGTIYFSGGAPTWGQYDNANGAPMSGPAITFFGAIYTTTIPATHVAQGVSGRVDSPALAFPEYLTINVTPPWAPAVADPIIYGQVFAADGNVVPGARDLAFDFATGQFKRTSRGGLALTQGLDAIRQDIELSLQLLLGEWFLDTTKGFPLLQRVLVKSPNIPAIRDLIRSHIEQRKGVATVTKLESVYDASARSFTVRFSANTDLGELSGAATFAR